MKLCWGIAFVLTFFIGNIAPAWGQPCPNAIPITISEIEKQGTYADPILQADKSGGIYVLYRKRIWNGVESKLWLQHLSPEGKPLWRGEGYPLCDEPGDQINPSIQIDNSSNAWIQWTQKTELSNLVKVQYITPAGIMPWGKAGKQVTYTEYPQKKGVIYPDPNGGLYIAWEEEREKLGQSWIFAQYLNSSGEPQWSANGRQVAPASAWQQNPVICPDTRGGIYIVWEDYRNKKGWQLWFQSLTPTGNYRFQKEGVRLLKMENAGQQQAKIVPDGFSGFFFACEKLDILNLETDIYFGRVNQQGLLAYQYAACTAFGDQRNPVIAERNQEVILVWEDKRSDTTCIYGQYVSLRPGNIQWELNGKKLISADYPVSLPALSATIEFNDLLVVCQANLPFGTEVRAFKFNNFGEPIWSSNGVSVCSFSSNQSSPVIASNTEGGCWIGWNDGRNVGGTKIYLQHLNLQGLPVQSSEGFTWIPETPVQQGNGSGIENVQLLNANDSMVWMIWEDYRQSPNDPDLYYKHIYHQDDHIEVSPDQPLCKEASDQTRPCIAPGANGSVWVVWSDRRNEKDEDLFIQWIHPTQGILFPPNGKPLISNTKSQSQPSIQSDGKGGVWIVWTDAREYDAQGFDIYVQHVDAYGNYHLPPEGLCVVRGKQDSHTPLSLVTSNQELMMVWMDNRNGYFNLFTQRISTDHTFLEEPSGRCISPALSHQRQPAMVQSGTEVYLVWSEERYGAGNDKIYWAKLSDEGRLLVPNGGYRLSNSHHRQINPKILADSQGKMLVLWKEITETDREGELLCMREIGEGEIPHIPISARVLAKKTIALDSPQILPLTSGGWIIAWIEQDIQPELRVFNTGYPSAPILSYPICKSRLPQRKAKMFSLTNSWVGLTWCEKVEEVEQLYLLPWKKP
ncbi:MAG: hypothetical protein EBS07_05535 [Sphingobacteriia bacterium]|nr:hypothetical protein [Sphingobacteriia bacterium]